MPSDFERDRALMEGHRNAATESYFQARPVLDLRDIRRAYEAAYTKAWEDCSAAVSAPGQDAEDAAKWREHVGKLDALVAYCPTCCEGKVATADMTRDEVIFQCGRTSGKSEAARAALASAPAAEPVSPMAKMAQALRDKAAAEKASFDARVQSGEWGPVPEAWTEADCQPEHVAQVEGDAAVRILRWNKNVGAFDYPVGTKLYAASAALASAPAAEPVGTLNVQQFRGHLENASFDYTGSLPDGTYQLYTAAPASHPQAQRAPITAEWVARMAKLEDGCDVGVGAGQAQRARYKVVDGSESAHCCFGATVVDTTRRLDWLDAEDEDRWESVCECFDREDADRIAAALNASIPPSEQEGKR